MKNLIKRFKGMIQSGAVIVGLFGMTGAFAENERDVSKYNIFVAGENLNGYDPVSYFPEGGGQPLLGRPENTLNYFGVTYAFATPANLQTFLSNPEKYEPTYGQWCAYAMASGSSVKINPLIYTINGNRLHFFVARRAKQNFDSDIAGFESNADKFWNQISGENPRK